MRSCPICGNPVLPANENRAFPFCSSRCRLVDLGRWLGEEYRIPVEERDAAEENVVAPPPEREDERDKRDGR